MNLSQIVKKVGLISCVLLASLIVSTAAYPYYGSVTVGGIQVTSQPYGGYYHGGYNNGYYGGGYHHWNNYHYHYHYHYNNYYH